MPEYDELYHLSDQDYVDVGCTQEELNQVKDYNQQLSEIEAQNKGK